MAARSRDGASRCEYSERIGGCSVADLTAIGSSSGALGWTPEDNRFGWRSYLATEPGADGIGAYAAPGRRQSDRPAADMDRRRYRGSLPR